MNEDGEIVTIASWYGPGFHGRKTASGERFNQHALTAASRTLPFGTRVKVRNLKNGKTCTVKINDRGPFVKGRGIDLSHEAARRLGIDGIAKVCYSTVPNFEPKRDVDADETPKAPGADGSLEVAVATGVTESIEKPLAMAVAQPHANFEALNEPPKLEQPKHSLEEQPEPFKAQIDLLRAQLKSQTSAAPQFNDLLPTTQSARITTPVAVKKSLERSMKNRASKAPVVQVAHVAPKVAAKSSPAKTATAWTAPAKTAIRSGATTITTKPAATKASASKVAYRSAAIKKASGRKQVSRTVAYSRASKKHTRSRRSQYIAHRRYKSKFGKSVDRLTARASHIYKGLKGIFAML